MEAHDREVEERMKELTKKKDFGKLHREELKGKKGEDKEDGEKKEGHKEGHKDGHK